MRKGRLMIDRLSYGSESERAKRRALDGTTGGGKIAEGRLQNFKIMIIVRNGKGG